MFVLDKVRLERENQQLKARIAGLERALDYAGVKLLEHKDRRAYEYVDKALCEDGPQRLAEIQADAVLDYGQELYVNGDNALTPEEYANQLRQQGGE